MRQRSRTLPPLVALFLGGCLIVPENVAMQGHVTLLPIATELVLCAIDQAPGLGGAHMLDITLEENNEYLASTKSQSHQFGVVFVENRYDSSWKTYKVWITNKITRERGFLMGAYDHERKTVTLYRPTETMLNALVTNNKVTLTRSEGVVTGVDGDVGRLNALVEGLAIEFSRGRTGFNPLVHCSPHLLGDR